jgi:aminopeptidase N
VLPEAEEDTRRMIPYWHDAVGFLGDTFGPYPFRADKYAVVHTPFLGMGYQTLNSYGSSFQLNAFGFDWLHFHEAAHEWWGNLVTASDWRDFWIHEGFATYAEALYAEHLAEEAGEDGLDAYRRYASAWTGRIQNVIPIAPRASRSTVQMTRLPDGRGSNDIYFKGAMVLHMLRWMVDDDDAFRLALRRLAYPDPELEAVTDGRQARFVSTADVVTAFALHTPLTAAQVEALFAIYLRQPDLPRLGLTRQGATATLRWETPDALPLALPVEVVVDGLRHRLSMTDGTATFRAPPEADVVVDPDSWLLIAD